MTIYSHSRLSTFEQCRLKFKYQYIDKIETEIENTIEAFLGSLVHDTLEKLYKELKLNKLNSSEDLINYYSEKWSKECTDAIKIIREGFTYENYHDLGVRFIKDFYERKKPFNQSKTIDTERRVLVNIDGHQLQGYIDRLAVNDNTYEIHDYKTANSLPALEHFKKDRQLALYSIAVKEMYPDAKRIKLIWHYLAFNKDICIEKTDEEREELKKATVRTIQVIEQADEYPPTSSALCNWCQFQSMCPMWTHKFKTDALPKNEYYKEEGVVLVKKYLELSMTKSEVEKELEKVKDAIYRYADTNNMKDLYGKTHRLAVRTYKNYKFPGRDSPLREHLSNLLKQIGLYDSVADIDTFKLSRMMKDGKVSKEYTKLLEHFAKEDTVRRIYPNVRRSP